MKLEAEIEKIRQAKMYIDKLANGINPLNDTPAEDADIINDVKIARCLFFVSDILRNIIESKNNNTNKKTKKVPFFIPDGKIQEFAFANNPVSISEITRRLNDIADLENCKKLKHSDITAWLIEIGALKVISYPDGKTVKRPTASGEKLGISTEIRMGMYGAYTVVIYNRAAQQFILDNIDAVIAATNSKL